MLLLVTTLSFSLYGQNYFFAEARESEISTAAGGKRVIIPEKYKSVVLDINGIQSFFKTLPLETNNRPAASESGSIIELPMPEGGRDIGLSSVSNKRCKRLSGSIPLMAVL